MRQISNIGAPSIIGACAYIREFTVCGGGGSGGGGGPRETNTSPIFFSVDINIANDIINRSVNYFTNRPRYWIITTVTLQLIWHQQDQAKYTNVDRSSHVVNGSVCVWLWSKCRRSVPAAVDSTSHKSLVILLWSGAHWQHTCIYINPQSQ